MRGIHGRLIDYGAAKVTLDASGNGTLDVAFSTPFIAPPQVFIVDGAADAGTRTAASITKDGFTLTVTDSDIVSQDHEFIWIAHEKD